MKKITQEAKLDVLLGLFVASLIAANFLGSKITTILGVSVSVGIFAYPISFLITDMIEEVMGKEKTKRFVLSGFIALVLVLILTLISVYLKPAGRYPYNEQYLIVFKSSLRMIIASFIAFGISQTHDIWAFNFWKQKTKGRFLWLRNNLSTAASQFIDTTIFMFIAFYQVAPKFTVGFIFTLIIPYWLFKIAFAILDTPFVYLGVKWLRGKEE